MRKKILDFNSYLKLNEGGGAGKEFKFSDVEFKIKYEYSADELVEKEKEFSLGDKFDLSGYMNGLSDINTEGIFEYDLSELKTNLTKECLDKLTIGQIRYFTHDVFEGVDVEKTLGEYVSETSEVLEIMVDGFGEIDKTIGSGYLSFSFKENETVMTLKGDDLNDGYNSWIGDGLVYDCLDKHCGLVVTLPSLKATEKFTNLWEDLFNQQSYDEYVKHSEKGGEEDIMDEDDYYDMLSDDLKTNYCS